MNRHDLMDSRSNDKCDENSLHEIQPPRDASAAEEISVKTNSENKKRGYVIQEILSTEATYVQNLKFAIEFVVKPLKEAKIPREEDIKHDERAATVVKQLNFLELIYNLHNDFRIDESLSQNLKFVELFDAIGQNIHCYSDYLINYEPAMKGVAHLLIHNRKFSAFFEKEELKNQRIESLLILPVQRIPRYRLLLQHLLRYTPQDHVDYHFVKSALDKICELAMYYNEAIESTNKLMDIMMSVEPTSRTDLLAEKGRRFIKEGQLLKQSRRRYQKRQFWLLSDQLLYGEMWGTLGLFEVKRRIPLARCKVSGVEEGDIDAKTAFIFESPEKSFKIKAKDEAEKTEWFEAIRNAIEKQTITHQDEKDFIAPVWQADTTSDCCELCAALFTRMNRRHHCRNCGLLVCDSCSANRFHLPHISISAVRVCVSCYDFLNSSSSLSSSITPSNMAVAANESPHESNEEDLLEFRRASFEEEQLNDFNDNP